MIKAIVVAFNFSQYATYIRNRGFKREEYGCYIAGRQEDCRGLDVDTTKVLWLDGWSENESYTTSDIVFLKERFNQHQNVSEVWIYGKGSFV